MGKPPSKGPFLRFPQAIRVVVDRLLYPGTMERGWASLAAITLFLGGVQLISLGLIGQYVGRIFEESKRRPLYFVKERVGSFPAGLSGARTSHASLTRPLD